MYEQIWRQEDYVPRKQVYLVDLPQNHIAKIKSVKFAFNDYKVYEKLSCLPYERMMVQCANQYGALFHLQNEECRDIAKYFNQCVKTLGVFNHMKRIKPQYFASNEYSRERPNFQEIRL